MAFRKVWRDGAHVREKLTAEEEAALSVRIVEPPSAMVLAVWALARGAAPAVKAEIEAAIGPDPKP